MITFSLLMVALALGSMVFFSFAVSPLIFAKLDKEKARVLIRDLFSIYYPFLAVMTTAAGLCVPHLWNAILLGLVALGFLLLLFVLMPTMSRLRDRGLQGNAETGQHVKRLHSLGVATNLVQITVLTFVFVASINGLPA